MKPLTQPFLIAGEVSPRTVLRTCWIGLNSEGSIPPKSKNQCGEMMPVWSRDHELPLIGNKKKEQRRPGGAGGGPIAPAIGHERPRLSTLSWHLSTRSPLSPFSKVGSHLIYVHQPFRVDGAAGLAEVPR